MCFCRSVGQTFIKQGKSIFSSSVRGGLPSLLDACAHYFNRVGLFVGLSVRRSFCHPSLKICKSIDKLTHNMFIDQKADVFRLRDFQWMSRSDLYSFLIAQRCDEGGGAEYPLTYGRSEAS